MSVPPPHTGEDPVQVLGELLEEIVEVLGIDAEVEVEQEGDLLRGLVLGDDLGVFIGHHGQTIEAVSHLARRIVLAACDEDLQIEVDADGYRARRADALRALADEAADEALAEGRPVRLEPMPAAERRIVHEHLRDRDGLETRSEGDEPRRRLVVLPAEA